ncbi:hypothetical protein K9L67_05645 [Candidatus Woesearchaeota archaeon]|nr:hypothetical protein [Candidatus Woesearchaeota archaeon]MCF7901678.1 hypothetical protein [Candidatus Woesearchaeota archaeon]MCF8013743.1 hypothetical protein [Candidatus Woesearchaeota archaeon]
MNWKTKELNKLWDLIKNSKNLEGKKYKGLKNSEFEEKADQFDLKYELKTGSQIIIKVDNINSAINELKNTYIAQHHISCACDNEKYKNDSALCIHYKKPPFFETPHSLILKGIKYIK